MKSVETIFIPQIAQRIRYWHFKQTDGESRIEVRGKIKDNKKWLLKHCTADIAALPAVHLAFRLLCAFEALTRNCENCKIFQMDVNLLRAKVNGFTWYSLFIGNETHCTGFGLLLYCSMVKNCNRILLLVFCSGHKPCFSMVIKSFETMNETTE